MHIIRYSPVSQQNARLAAGHGEASVVVVEYNACVGRNALRPFARLGTRANGNGHAAASFRNRDRAREAGHVACYRQRSRAGLENRTAARHRRVYGDVKALRVYRAATVPYRRRRVASLAPVVAY